MFPVYFTPFFPYAVYPDSSLALLSRFTLEPTSCARVLHTWVPVYFVPFLPYAVTPDRRLAADARLTPVPTRAARVGPVTFPEPLWYPAGTVTFPPDAEIVPFQAPRLTTVFSFATICAHVFDAMRPRAVPSPLATISDLVCSKDVIFVSRAVIFPFY